MKNLPVLRTLTEKVRLQDTNRNCGSTTVPVIYRP